MKEELKKKDEKLIENEKIIKEELEKLKKENKNLLDSNKEKDTELNKLKIKKEENKYCKKIRVNKMNNELKIEK